MQVTHHLHLTPSTTKVILDCTVTLNTHLIKNLNLYQIGNTGDQLSTRTGQNQPLECDDLVRVKLDNTERVNKLSPLYSEHIYKVQSVNKTSNTYIIVRIGTEISGIRTKRFLYHRRRLKKYQNAK